MDTSKLTTSTGFRYENSFAKSVEKFPTLARLATKATFGIPGLALTKVEDGLCECMTPQGICVAGPYVLITARRSCAAAAITPGRSRSPPRPGLQRRRNRRRRQNPQRRKRPP
ncbi:MAG: hypothetical protein IIT43_03170, partial [Clostridia bacterium]|nr:hypothetical protein [Clostridia bacterium]